MEHQGGTHKETQREKREREMARISIEVQFELVLLRQTGGRVFHGE